MKKLIASLACVLSLFTMTGCFTAAGSIAGQHIQIEKNSRGEESHAHIEGTAIGAALDIAAVAAIIAIGASRMDFGPSQPHDPSYGVRDQ